MWGSAIDPTLAEKYEFPDEPNEGHNLPPHPTSTDVLKHHPKPTAHLPEDHATATGEATKPAFQTDDKSGTAAATDIPTTFPEAAEEGVFNNMYDLLSNQLWLIGAFGIVTVFGVATCTFFWLRRRKVRRAKSSYAPIPGDNMTMRPLDRGGAAPAGSGAPGAGERSAGGTRELYDAFGVGSDEEDEGQDVDEHSALTGGAAGRFGQAVAPLTYHDGFLDDEGASTARSAAAAPYRDYEPAPAGEPVAPSRRSPAREGSDGSGDGSWQDAAVDHETAPLRP
jgi:kexin